MTTLRLNSDNEGISKAAELLKSGGIVAIPTETVYGLAANALDGKTVKQIFAAKGRPQDNPLIVHISSIDELPALVEEVDERAYKLAEKFWPGPLTIIMKKSAAVPDEVTAGLGTVAIRMPSNPVAAQIIRESGLPLAAPSANASGKPSPTRAAHVLLDLDGKIDAVVDGGECSVGVESTVITLATPVPTLLRPGGITPEQLESVLGKIEISSAVFKSLKPDEKAQSPGMKYKHYSPNARITIIKGSFEKYKNFLNAQKFETCAVCFDGEGQYFDKAIEYGKEDDSMAQARNLFDCLRKVDDLGYKRAFVRCPDSSGVGLAVYNRLLRSAAFKIIDLNYDLPVIGLTGPTGAGKGTMWSELVNNGCYVIDTDAVAHKVLQNPEVINELTSAFGYKIVDDDGVVNRKTLGYIAFSSPENTEILNSITHPEISRLTIEEFHKAEEINSRAVVIDAPVLFESDLYSLCNKTICVTAPREERIRRIISRDNISQEDAIRRMDAQRSEEYYKSHSDYVIENYDLFDSLMAIDRIAKEIINNG